MTKENEYKILRSSRPPYDCTVNIEVLNESEIHYKPYYYISIDIGKIVLKDLIKPLMVGKETFWGHYTVEVNDYIWEDEWRLTYISPFTDYRKEGIITQEACLIEDRFSYFSVRIDDNHLAQRLITPLMKPKSERGHYKIKDISYRIETDESGAKHKLYLDLSDDGFFPRT